MHFYIYGNNISIRRKIVEWIRSASNSSDLDKIELIETMYLDARYFMPGSLIVSILDVNKNNFSESYKLCNNFVTNNDCEQLRIYYISETQNEENLNILKTIFYCPNDHVFTETEIDLPKCFLRRSETFVDAIRKSMCPSIHVKAEKLLEVANGNLLVDMELLRGMDLRGLKNEYYYRTVNYKCYIPSAELMADSPLNLHSIKYESSQMRWQLNIDSDDPNVKYPVLMILFNFLWSPRSLGDSSKFIFSAYNNGFTITGPNHKVSVLYSRTIYHMFSVYSNFNYESSITFVKKEIVEKLKLNCELWSGYPIYRPLETLISHRPFTTRLIENNITDFDSTSDFFCFVNPKENQGRTMKGGWTFQLLPSFGSPETNGFSTGLVIHNKVYFLDDAVMDKQEIEVRFMNNDYLVTNIHFENEYLIGDIDYDNPVPLEYSEGYHCYIYGKFMFSSKLIFPSVYIGKTKRPEVIYFGHSTFVDDPKLGIYQVYTDIIPIGEKGKELFSLE